MSLGITREKYDEDYEEYEKEVQKLVDALRFYANEENYKWRDRKSTEAGILLPNPNKEPLVTEDNGKKAREALSKRI